MSSRSCVYFPRQRNRTQSYAHPSRCASIKPARNHQKGNDPNPVEYQNRITHYGASQNFHDTLPARAGLSKLRTRTGLSEHNLRSAFEVWESLHMLWWGSHLAPPTNSGHNWSGQRQLNDMLNPSLNSERNFKLEAKTYNH